MKAMTERDLATLETLVHPQVRFRSLITRMSGNFTGIEGLRGDFAELDGSFEDVRWEFLELVAHEEDVSVVHVRFRATGRGSGVRIDEVHRQVWRRKGGLGYENEVHSSLEEALASAGIAQ